MITVETDGPIEVDDILAMGSHRNRAALAGDPSSPAEQPAAADGFTAAQDDQTVERTAQPDQSDQVPPPRVQVVLARQRLNAETAADNAYQASTRSVESDWKLRDVKRRSHSSQELADARGDVEKSAQDYVSRANESVSAWDRARSTALAARELHKASDSDTIGDIDREVWLCEQGYKGAVRLRGNALENASTVHNRL